MNEDENEPRVTWVPDPERTWLPLPDSNMEHGPGYFFFPDGKGGGVLKRRSKVTKRYMEVSKVTPHGA